MDTQTAAVATEEPEPWLPEDIRRIPPEFRDAELLRITQNPTKWERERHEMETRIRAAELGIPYP